MATHIVESARQKHGSPSRLTVRRCPVLDSFAWHLGPLARARGFASCMLFRYACGAGAGRLLIARPAALRFKVAKAGK